ncbi:MAG: hypothetical protein QXS02_05865 [Candidatus Thermoplasmatota archaeon]
MGRRQTMMEKFKQQMKAYKKKRMRIDNTPYVPPDRVVYVMDTLNPNKKIKAEIIKTSTRAQREIIESISCPVCNNPMDWDENWEAFICTKHGSKAIYEIIKNK